ncbi:MAG TPA: hypothetical protein PKO06_00275 [Candidatus Ozemobacteraceae bacterium]|nr:hypothetical protein [Candidatus Ozemobacteraceae bacterium]
MPRHLTKVLLVAICLAGLNRSMPAGAAKDPFQQLGKLLQAKVAESLTQQFIRFDQKTGLLEFSPACLQLAGQLVQKNDKTFETFSLTPEGNALHFSIKTKAGTAVSASVIPESLELGLEEMAIRGKLPGGLQITSSEDVQKSIGGFFDSLFGAASQITELMKNFTVEGDTFRLKRPIKASALGRTLRSQIKSGSDGPAGTTSETRTLNMRMESGWLKLELGQIGGMNTLMKFAIEQLTSKLQGK